jgi:hypothetical protein
VEADHRSGEIRLRVWESWPRWRRVWAVVGAVVIVGNTLLGVVTHAPQGTLVLRFVVLAVGVGLAVHARQSVLVTRDGIREPGRRPVSWAEVAQVRRPTAFSDQVVLRMTSGRERAVQLPARLAPDVARLGDKDLF